MPSRESIQKVSRSAHSKIVKHLQSLGVNVSAIDGPSSDVELYSLQALQAVEAALDQHVNQKSAPAENVTSLDGFGQPVPDSKKAK